MMVNLVVRTPESIVSFGFLKFLHFLGLFSLFSTCIQMILVCKPLYMVYSSILQLQFYWMINEAYGRSNNGENWTVAEIVAEKWMFPMCQGARNGNSGLAQKNSVLHCSYMSLILQKITFSI